MHEITICQSILRQLDKYKNIKSVTFEIGTLAPITSAELKETMEKMVNYKINIIEKEAKIKCSCKYTGTPHIAERAHDIVVYDCPCCGKTPDVLSGNNIIIKNIEL